MSFLSPLPDNATGKAKGVVAQGIQAFIKDRFGESGYQSWLEALSVDARIIFSSEVFASTWYTVATSVVEPHHQLCRKFYSGNLEGSYQTGYFSAQLALRGIYKIFVQLGSVSFTLERVPRLLSMHYLGADASVVENKPGRAVVHLTHFPQHSPHIDHAIAGWSHGALDIIGASEPKASVTRSLSKDDHSEFVLTWTP